MILRLGHLWSQRAPRAGLVFSVRLTIAMLHASSPVEILVWRGREEKRMILISVSNSLLAYHKVCLVAVQYSWTRRLSQEPLKSCRTQLYLHWGSKVYVGHIPQVKSRRYYFIGKLRSHTVSPWSIVLSTWNVRRLNQLGTPVFNLERLSRSFRLALPGISPLERLWFRRRTFHVPNLMDKLL